MPLEKELLDYEHVLKLKQKYEEYMEMNENAKEEEKGKNEKNNSGSQNIAPIGNIGLAAVPISKKLPYMALFKIPDEFIEDI